MNHDDMLDIKNLANDPAYAEATRDMAKLLRMKYEALVAAGFTAEAALYIVTYQGLEYGTGRAEPNEEGM